jgi:hypothetical protein
LLLLGLLAGPACRRLTAPRTAWLPRHAPWPDNETSCYDVLRSDTIVGRAVIHVRREPEENRPAYCIVSVNRNAEPGIGRLLLHDSIAAWLSADSLIPLRSYQVRNRLSQQDTVVSVYQPGRVSLTLAGRATRVLDAPSNTFDNSILVTAIRTLELVPGAHYALTSLAVFGPWTKPVDIDVEGEETVTVPAGTFPCYRLGLQIAGFKLHLWYEKNEPRRYVRFENASGSSVAVLTSYQGTGAPGEPQRSQRQSANLLPRFLVSWCPGGEEEAHRGFSVSFPDSLWCESHD